LVWWLTCGRLPQDHFSGCRPSGGQPHDGFWCIQKMDAYLMLSHFKIITRSDPVFKY